MFRSNLSHADIAGLREARLREHEARAHYTMVRSQGLRQTSPGNEIMRPMDAQLAQGNARHITGQHMAAKSSIPTNEHNI
jgi:hypothetical protein